MANMLKAISLLLIGGGLGALAAGGHDQVDLQQASPDKPEVARAEINYIHVGSHRALAARTEPVAEPGRLPTRHETRIRAAQGSGAISDARRIPVPTMRPILVGTRDTDTAAKSNGRAAEARIAESIQKELKRVGCYAGAIDGDWGPETRRAMQAFNDRVNATLPTVQPDYILLTLLQGHTAKACGAACPAGQDLSGSGKCLPRSVIAEERRRLADERTAGLQTRRATAALSANVAGETSTNPADNAEAKAQAARQAHRAEIERERIAAAEQRRQQKVAEAEARAESDRLARLAAAEKARAAAESRRREELAALAARSAAKRRVAAAESIAAPTPNITTGSVATLPPPPLPVRPSPSFRQDVAMRDDARIEVEKAAPARHKASRRDSHRRPRGARYAGHFVPPPVYRVGRLAPMRPASFRVYAYAPRQAQRGAHNPQRIFREMQYLMP